MRLRAVHLAGIFLLLATMSAAEASVAQSSAPRRAHYISVLMAQHEAAVRNAGPLIFSSRLRLAPAPPDASLPGVRAERSITPPAEQTAHTHAVTGSSL